MKLKITIGLFLAAFLLSAQTTRMNRDIEVAEKILESLIEEANGDEITEKANVFIIGSSAEVEGTYIEGFGAMFSITSGNLSNPLILTDTKKSKSGKSTSYSIIRSNKRKIHIDEKDLQINRAAIQKIF